MIIKNGLVFNEQNRFIESELYINDSCIVATGISNDTQVIDATDCYVIPGLTDIHTHGCVGYDTCDSSIEAMNSITSYQLSHGITTFCPTTMTLPEDQLLMILNTIHNYKLSNSDNMHADIIGVYLEGPFIAASKKGAQDSSYIQKPNSSLLDRLQNAAHGLIRIVAIAPEEDHSMQLIHDYHNEVTFSIAHTNTSYKTCMEAFHNGAKQVTHLYNAMPGLHHRFPSVIGAANDNKQVFVELIADGNHIHPSVVRLTFDLFGSDRIILISDSMSATAMADGKYSLGGQTVYVKDSIATLEDNVTIAGSTTNLYDCMCRAINMGVSIESAVKAACVNPIKSLGLYDQYGSLSPNKKANILVITKDLKIQHIIKNGILIR